MVGPPAARRRRLSDKWICRYSDSREIESDGLTSDVFIPAALPPQRCPSHKSPNQPSRMSPIYFTSRSVILGAASPISSSTPLPPLFRLLYWVLTRDASCGFPMQAHRSMVYWRSLPFYGVISFGPFPARIVTARFCLGILILVCSSREDREARKKKENHKASAITSLVSGDRISRYRENFERASSRR